MSPVCQERSRKVKLYILKILSTGCRIRKDSLFIRIGADLEWSEKSAE